MIPKPLKPRSLFWTFAWTFFAVLLLASLVQFALGFWAIQALERSIAQEAAEETAEKTVFALQRNPMIDDRRDILRLLRMNLAHDRALLTVYRNRSGELLSARFIDEEPSRRLETLLQGRLIRMSNNPPPPRREDDDDRRRDDPPPPEDSGNDGDQLQSETYQPSPYDNRPSLSNEANQTQPQNHEQGYGPPPRRNDDGYRGPYEHPPRRNDGASGSPPRDGQRRRPPRQGGDGYRPPDRNENRNRPPPRDSQDGHRPPPREDRDQPPQNGGNLTAIRSQDAMLFKQPRLDDNRRPPRNRNDRRRPPRDRESFYPASTKWQELTRTKVTLHSGEMGEVIMVRALDAGLFERLPASYLMLFFFPMSALIGGVAALLLLKTLMRRLKGLERLTQQLAAGNMSVRMKNPGDDEIGRLGHSFNLMAEALEGSSSKVEDAERQRRHLLADISHELATPLTSIRGYSETMLDDQIPSDPQEDREYLSYIYKESVRMGHLIQDLLELARIEAGHRTLDYEAIDWASLCYNTTIRLHPQFRKAHLTLEFSGLERGAMIRGDGLRLEQVLDNLLVNALRYVPHGCIVKVNFEDAKNPPNTWRLEVSDNGRGIPEHDLPFIFDRFYRSQATRTSKGSGLGLAIVKELVNRHGGTIKAKKNPAGGATFVIEIPKLRQNMA